MVLYVLHSHLQIFGIASTKGPVGLGANRIIGEGERDPCQKAEKWKNLGDGKAVEGG